MSSQDISMKVKMSAASFASLAGMGQGQPAEDAEIHGLCDYIDQRFDCADFRATRLLKAIWAYPHLLSDSAKERIHTTLLNFKYWMDEPGDDSMCYWSENHQLLFHTCEYMAGSLWPDDIFPNSGMTGQQHAAKALPKLLQWFRHKWDFGFIEWHSNTYYEEDIGPLALLIDHAPNEEVRIKASMMMDLLLLDIAMFSYDGAFITSSGRCYEHPKKDAHRQATRDAYHHAFSNEPHTYGDGRLTTVFRLSKSYQLPPVLHAIAHDQNTRVLRDSTGLDLAELRDHLPMDDMAESGALIWQMEAFTNPETINLTMDMFHAYGMETNDFLKDMKMIGHPLLRKSGILPLLVRILNPSTRGVAIQRSNNYTYKTAHYMLSTAQRHHAGEFGDQQHIWHAALPNNVQVFTTHPGAPFFDDQARNFSPDYWVGNGVMPDAAQHENTHLCIYRANVRKGFLERQRLHFTHAFFPQDRMDDVIVRENRVYGRTGDSYIALMGAHPITLENDEEIIQQGAITAWVCRVSHREASGTFHEFIDDMDKKMFNFNGRTLQFDNLSLTYKGPFTLDGHPIDTQCPRYDTPYVQADTQPQTLDIQHDGLSLHLDFDQMIRNFTTRSSHEE